jgi:hypothetical protein
MPREWHRTAATLTAFSVLLSACFDDERHLRGTAKASHDGGTYLAILDDHDGTCRPLSVDGQEWPHALGVVHPIEPGKHRIVGRCGWIDFRVSAGTIFYFDYWGP